MQRSFRTYLLGAQPKTSLISVTSSLVSGPGTQQWSSTTRHIAGHPKSAGSGAKSHHNHNKRPKHEYRQEYLQDGGKSHWDQNRQRSSGNNKPNLRSQFNKKFGKSQQKPPRQEVKRNEEQPTEETVYVVVYKDGSHKTVSNNWQEFVPLTIGQPNKNKAFKNPTQEQIDEFIKESSEFLSLVKSSKEKKKEDAGPPAVGASKGNEEEIRQTSPVPKKAVPTANNPTIVAKMESKKQEEQEKEKQKQQQLTREGEKQQKKDPLLSELDNLVLDLSSMSAQPQEQVVDKTRDEKKEDDVAKRNDGALKVNKNSSPQTEIRKENTDAKREVSVAATQAAVKKSNESTKEENEQPRQSDEKAKREDGFDKSSQRATTTVPERARSWRDQLSRAPQAATGRQREEKKEINADDVKDLHQARVALEESSSQVQKLQTAIEEETREVEELRRKQQDSLKPMHTKPTIVAKVVESVASKESNPSSLLPLSRMESLDNLQLFHPLTKEAANEMMLLNKNEEGKNETTNRDLDPQVISRVAHLAKLSLVGELIEVPRSSLSTTTTAETNNNKEAVPHAPTNITLAVQMQEAVYKVRCEGLSLVNFCLSSLRPGDLLHVVGDLIVKDGEPTVQVKEAGGTITLVYGPADDMVDDDDRAPLLSDDDEDTERK